MSLLAAVLLVAAPKLNAILTITHFFGSFFLRGEKVDVKRDSTLPPPGGRVCARVYGLVQADSTCCTAFIL